MSTATRPATRMWIPPGSTSVRRTGAGHSFRSRTRLIE